MVGRQSLSFEGGRCKLCWYTCLFDVRNVNVTQYTNIHVYIVCVRKYIIDKWCVKYLLCQNIPWISETNHPSLDGFWHNLKKKISEENMQKGKKENTYIAVSSHWAYPKRVSKIDHWIATSAPVVHHVPYFKIEAMTFFWAKEIEFLGTKKKQTVVGKMRFKKKNLWQLTKIIKRVYSY